jgi:carbamoyl-phosphate synthase/aspartate carbamoyltransferase
MLGKIEFEGHPVSFSDPNERHLVNEVSPRTVRVFGRGGRPAIIAFDCGMKNNIVRYLVCALGVMLTVVPFDYDLQRNEQEVQYDGVFVSNGPGDPLLCEPTIRSLRWAISGAIDPPKPIFGICLGNQLLALACGATTYKMKYGNRGLPPMTTTNCIINFT